MKNNNNYDNNRIIFSGVYHLISGLLITLFLISIANTSKVKIKDDMLNEDVLNVGHFITDLNFQSSDEDLILSYLKNLYAIRNDSFITGNVEDLYRFYDISNNFGAYSLEHEFKRIAFLRDWANKKGANFINISSEPKINSIKKGEHIYNLVLREDYTLDYAYSNEPENIKTFSVALVHNIELQKVNDTFIITKDYYEDCFEAGLNKYDFDLTEKEIPLTEVKSVNL
jgi:hypothetical protein